MLPIGAKDWAEREWWTEEHQKAKGPGTLIPEKGKAVVVFQKGIGEVLHSRHVSRMSPPPRVHLNSSCGGVTDRGGLPLPPLRLHPSCYSSAVSSDKCLLCHTSLLQCNRFILPLPYTLPPSICRPPVCPFSYVHLHSLTHTNAHSHTWGARIQMGCLP